MTHGWCYYKVAFNNLENVEADIKEFYVRRDDNVVLVAANTTSGILEWHISGFEQEYVVVSYKDCKFFKIGIGRDFIVRKLPAS